MNTARNRQISSVAFSEVVQKIESLGILITILDEDVAKFRAANDGAGRRALVRAAFAYIEGTSFGFRFVALHFAKVRDVALTVGEALMASEITYALNDKGQVEEKSSISSPLANLRFAMMIFAKATGVRYEFPAADSHYEQLQRMQRIRNRLAHPRSSDELDVSIEEEILVLGVVSWIMEQQTKLMMAFTFRLRSALQHFYSGVDALPKVESGGYSVDDVERIFSKGLQGSDPVSFEDVEAWFTNFLKTNTKSALSM